MNIIDDEMRDDPNWGKVYEGPDDPPYTPFWLKVAGVIVVAIGLLGLAWAWG